jgi:DeoR family fructose operon transcriptional repressor
MFADERHRAILDLLAAHGRVNAADLAERFQTTRETIRRDLTALEEVGALRRVHGGAVSFGSVTTMEIPQHLRAEQNLSAKTAIGRAARALLTSGGQSILLDAGTTTLQLAAAIVESPMGPEPLVAVTNSVPIAQLLSGAGDQVRLELVGGAVRSMTLSTVGPETLARFSALRADHAFLGVNALTAGFGLSTPDASEAAVKRAMILAARHVVVLADSAKFTDATLNKFADFSEVDVLITDAAPPADLAAELDAADVDVRIV